MWPTELQAQALAVMMIESGNNHIIHNLNHKTKDDSWGCFQINRYGRLGTTRPAPEWLTQADNNVRYALNMYQREGWKPWANTIKKLETRR